MVYVHLRFVSGGSMQDWIKKVKPSVGRIRHVFRGIVNALVYLHSVPIAHRDLKLSNSR